MVLWLQQLFSFLSPPYVSACIKQISGKDIWSYFQEYKIVVLAHSFHSFPSYHPIITYKKKKKEKKKKKS